MKLTDKEWAAIRQWFRCYEAELRSSYGEPHNKEETFQGAYKNADPTGYVIYESARRVIDGDDGNG